MKELYELKQKLELEMLIKYSKEALKLLGLKIGDNVKCEFRSSYISNKNSYTSSKIEVGIIKANNNGVVYVESGKPIKQTYNKSNNRTGRTQFQAYPGK